MNTFESNDGITEESKRQGDIEKGQGKNYIKKFAPLAAGMMMLADASSAIAKEKNIGDAKPKAPIRISDRKNNDMDERLRINVEAKDIQDLRMQELNIYLNKFSIDGLKIGKAQKLITGYMEQLGVYLGKQHLADVRSPRGPFSEVQLLDTISQIPKVKEIINKKKSGLQNPEQSRVNIIEDPDALEILTSWGGGIDRKNRLIYISSSENPLAYDANAETIRLKRMTNNGRDGLAIVCVNKDGKVSTAYAEGGIIKINSFESK